MIPPPPPPMLTPRQLAERWQWRVTASTLMTWRSRGTGPRFVKIGGRVLYRLSDVLDYEARQTRGK